jgi:hypothetical protein
VEETSVTKGSFLYVTLRYVKDGLTDAGLDRFMLFIKLKSARSSINQVLDA